MEIKVTKKDIIWSYSAKFFNIAAGLITLPLVLNKLSAEEVGLNYIMMTVGTLVALFDFGFAPQFGRNITYIFSGTQTLRKEGVDPNDVGTQINYHLLKSVICTAKYVYKRLSVVVLLFMLTVGTIYMYSVTDGFETIENSFVIWLTYCLSVFFNIYFTYYSSLLSGAALIKEQQKAMIFSRVTYIFFVFILLHIGCGLISVVIANMVAPFVSRYYSHKKFFTRDLKAKYAEHHITKNNIKETFDVLWYNSKKLGINFIGAYGINKASMFIAGLYLSLTDIGTFGIMTQLVTIVSTISSSMFLTYLPIFNKLRAQGDNSTIVRLFSFNMVVFYVIYIVGILVIILFGPWVLRLIGSSTVLPCTGILVVFSIITLLENNHSNFASLITTNNEVPFVKAGLLSGVIIVVLTLFVLNVTTWGLWGIVIVQGVVQLAYNNWYWPQWIFNELHFDVCGMLKCGITELLKKIKLL